MQYSLTEYWNQVCCVFDNPMRMMAWQKQITNQNYIIRTALGRCRRLVWEIQRKSEIKNNSWKVSSTRWVRFDLKLLLIRWNAVTDRERYVEESTTQCTDCGLRSTSSAVVVLRRLAIQCLFVVRPSVVQVENERTAAATLYDCSFAHC